MPTITHKILIAFTLLLVGYGSTVYAKPKLNAPRTKNEPGWTGPSRLSSEAKTTNQSIPILERSYRPMHVYGNMTRRHHYRGTVIPSHRDRTEMLETLVSKEPAKQKYVNNRYR